MAPPEPIRIELEGDERWSPIEVFDHTRVPLALADLHRRLTPGQRATVTIPAESTTSPDRRYGFDDLILGAGFAPSEPGRTAPASERGGRISVYRVHTLADTVGAGMTVLICGLNPSLYSADVGVGFGRPGNRFWPAAIQAGLVTTTNDPRAALTDHNVGMTDLVKRPTRRADELSTDEYREGIERLERLAGWLQPAIICFVGLAGWRAAVNRNARAGRQPELVGNTTVYLMPSTSGLNAHSRLDDLADHLGHALTLAQQSTIT